MKKRTKIEIEIGWCYGDASTRIKLSPSQWQQVCDGQHVSASTWSYYEGKRQRVGVSFNDPTPGDLQVGGGDGEEFFDGKIEEARITNAEYPAKPSSATEFIVDDRGTLEMAGIGMPETRGDAYNLSPMEFEDAGDLLNAADECQPLAWMLQSAYSSAREAIEFALAAPAGLEADPKKRAKLEATLAAMPVEPEEGFREWLESQPRKRLRPVIREVRAWLKEEPTWSEEEDHIPPHTTGQGAALKFFQGMKSDDLEALGVKIVEGEHPGSTYYAAELTGNLKSANLAAIERRLDVWFRRA